MPFLKRLAASLPMSWQHEIKRRRFKRQIRQGAFATDEPEFELLPDLIESGDWVIDVGANVGHYTKRFSDLVGRHGRVVALEPVPATFSLLASNAQAFAHENVTLLNAAASDRTATVGMRIPRFDTGLTNFYMAHIEGAAGAPSEQTASGSMEAIDVSADPLEVMTFPLDSLGLEQDVALVKIDAEGHEAAVLAGMHNLLETSRPTLIVETQSEQVVADLKAIGYRHKRLDHSPNIVFQPEASAEL